MLFDVCLKNIDIYFDRFNFKPELQTNWSGRFKKENDNYMQDSNSKSLDPNALTTQLNPLLMEKGKFRNNIRILAGTCNYTLFGLNLLVRSRLLLPSNLLQLYPKIWMLVD